jgi:DNA-3-methyladenine glycosylase I
LTDDGRVRCFWATSDPLMAKYHDEDWAIPCHEDSGLFERLTLEAFQSGLAWRTILYKRESFVRAFEAFDIEKVASFNETDIERLLQDSSIVRHRKKIEATVYNAGAILDIQKEHGSFDGFLWGMAGQIEEVCRDFRRRFRFVGPTVCYSFLESVGMVNDHELTCWRVTG